MSFLNNLIIRNIFRIRSNTHSTSISSSAVGSNTIKLPEEQGNNNDVLTMTTNGQTTWAQHSGQVNVVDNSDGTITIGNTTIDICEIVRKCGLYKPAAINDNIGFVTAGSSTQIDVSQNDILCVPPNVTTYIIVPGSETNVDVSPGTSPGVFHITAGVGPFSFQVEMLCNGISMTPQEISTAVGEGVIVPVVVDDDVGMRETGISFDYNVSTNDTLCPPPKITSYNLVPGSEINATVTTNGTGVYTITPLDDGPFSFQTEMLCDGSSINPQQISTLSGISYTSVNLINNVDPSVNGNWSNASHFNLLSFQKLFNGVTDVTQDDEKNQRLHQDDEKGNNYIDVKFNQGYTATDSVQIHWNNQEEPEMKNNGWLGLEVLAGSDDTNLSQIYIDTGPQGSIGNHIIDVTPGFTFSYIRIKSVADDDGKDPIVLEITINNIPNV